MAIIKCPECHSDISDHAKICPKCGYTIINENKKTGYYKITTGLILNSLATLFWLIFFVFIFVLNDLVIEPNFTPERYVLSNSNYDIKFYASDFYLSIIGIILTIILGFVIYATKKNGKLTFLLSIIFLLFAIISFGLFYLNIINMTCGLGIIILIPCILQIVASVKYMSGSRLCMKEN